MALGYEDDPLDISNPLMLLGDTQRLVLQQCGTDFVCSETLFAFPYELSQPFKTNVQLLPAGIRSFPS